MMAKQRTPSVYQRNAFAPGLLAAAGVTTGATVWLMGALFGMWPGLIAFAVV